MAWFDHGLRQHPRSITAALAVVLLGSGVTAFGLAPLAPDAADLPRRLIVEPFHSGPALAPQLEALSAHTTALHRSELTRSADTVDSLLLRLGVSDPDAAAFLRRDATARKLLEGRPGKRVHALASEGRLLSLTARYPVADAERASSHFTRMSIERASDEPGSPWRASLDTAALQTETRLASATIYSSLFAAADDARLPDAVTVQVAEIFGTDIDFRRDLRRGDHFSVLYESRTADGEAVSWGGGTGRVLAAQFVNAGKIHEAVWFDLGADEGSAGRGAYFDLQGRSLKRMFLGSPLEFSRVSSGFAMRLHPILKTWRAHLGVDYAAPSGTAVRAVGDGVVAFSGWQTGYGQVVTLRHSGERETRYAHLSRLDVRVGQRVEQGQSLGAVGATGWATGPHLHFEFRVGGEVKDPLVMARASEALVLSPAQRPHFEALALTAGQWFAASGGGRSGVGQAVTVSRFE